VLALNTDGRAIVNRNDLEKGLRQVVRDTSAYYLLGYNSSAPADGKFHEISPLEAAGRASAIAKGKASAPQAPSPPPAVEKALAASRRASATPTSRHGSAPGGAATAASFVWAGPPIPGEAPGRGARQVLAQGRRECYRGPVPPKPAPATGGRRRAAGPAHGSKIL
jgi:hypothetical protein